MCMKLLTVYECHKVTGINPVTIYKLIKSGMPHERRDACIKGKNRTAVFVNVAIVKDWYSRKYAEYVELQRKRGMLHQELNKIEAIQEKIEALCGGRQKQIIKDCINILENELTKAEREVELAERRSPAWINAQKVVCRAGEGIKLLTRLYKVK